MSQSKKQTTVYGEVEFETVECDSCGSEVVKEDAKRFVIGELKRERSRHNCQRYEFENGTVSAGWACPYCHDVGPVDYPSDNPVSRWWNSLSTVDREAVVIIGLAGLAFFVVTLAAVVP